MQQYVTYDQIMTLQTRYEKRLLEHQQRPCCKLPVIWDMQAPLNMTTSD